MSLPVKPDELEWASNPDPDDIDTPDNARKQTGWTIIKPPLQWFNYWMNLAWKWQIYFENRQLHTELLGGFGPFGPGTSKNRKFHFDCTLGEQQFTLPAITNADNDLTFELKKVDASANKVVVTGTVEGEVNPSIDYQYTGRSVYAYNGLWYWGK